MVLDSLNPGDMFMFQNIKENKHNLLCITVKVFQKNTFFDFNEADNIFPLHYTM